MWEEINESLTKLLNESLKKLSEAVEKVAYEFEKIFKSIVESVGNGDLIPNKPTYKPVRKILPYYREPIKRVPRVARSKC